MPHKASRITLEITNVRVERVQGITESDCIAEGIQAKDCWRELEPGRKQLEGPIWAYQQLWDSLNADRNGGIYSWANNPWVWCISFRRIQP